MPLFLCQYFFSLNVCQREKGFGLAGPRFAMPPSSCVITSLFNRKPNAKNDLVPGARTCNTSWMQERRQGAQLPCWLTAKEWKIGACNQEWNPI